uniref:ATP synthase subunit a n=5 Tax=Metschnikowia TaxID=27320 RepID=A0A7D7J3X0_9ASCO|nr:Atp6 [Metschnikowia dekortorum]YP_009935227.1 Atp6 [Metschnikowia similis]QMQ98426.1 Atp6 [Metschnikowia sp. UFMG-CM-y6306]QMQ98462.1 Atp6 [Metschnikowia sp. UWOPS 03-167b3]QNS23105.1 Atp6 [Metschnikowia bowlesiae]QMQ98434.1 Atp6 [Metschnikowia dekortorum]QMQ98580.1 Atp6 [Metschnikowia dekortorum]
MFFSPLDQFEIKPLLTMNNMMTFSMSNFVIYSLMVAFMMYGFNMLLNKTYLGWNRWGVAMLAMYDTMLNMVKSQVGARGGMYFPFMFTLFNFMLMANVMSMMPYSFAMSAQMVAIMSLSLTLWLGLTMMGFVNHGLGFFSLFVPTGTPLALVPVLVLMETLSYSSKAMSLGLRLSANMLSGHLLMLMLGSLILNLMSSSMLGFVSGFIPMAGVMAITILEFAMAMIQAYVFCILFSGYLKDAIYLH